MVREKLEMEAQTALGIIEAMGQDLADLERWFPPSKRGSNAQRVLDQIHQRRAVALQSLKDGLSP